MRVGGLDMTNSSCCHGEYSYHALLLPCIIIPLYIRTHVHTYNLNGHHTKEGLILLAIMI